MKSYDVVIIGAGPAGYVCAIRAAQLKLKVALVEKRWLGGVCLNVGCIPSKSLLSNAEIIYTIRTRGKELGFSFENLVIDYKTAVKRSRQVSSRLVKGIDFLIKKNGIDLFIGTATISAKNHVTITDEEEKELDLSTKNIIIATGAQAFVPPAWPIDNKRVLTYSQAILQEELPKSVVIIGGGAIGMEFGSLWNAYGVDVTIVEMLPHILPLEDSEAAEEVTRVYSKKGMKLLPGYKVQSIEHKNNEVRVTATSNHESLSLIAEQVLVAMGFQPNSKDCGIEEIGVKLDGKGFVEINTKMETSVAGIWAIGDVTGKLMLAHVGSAMGVICAENIAGLQTKELDYALMPRATYTSPQVASFGLTEAQAREQGRSIKVGRFPFQANGKALGLGNYTGWIKIVADDNFGEILGATLVGPEVTELLPELTLSQMMELTVSEIARNVHSHPTLSEVLMEAAAAVEGNAIHI